jgi:2-polyprenyl-3-methyl-5-hydroxy-6-metoxy-1,4-benzoquinol methylase
MGFLDTLKVRATVCRNIITFQSKSCPYCGSEKTTYIGRNAPLSHVRKCHHCALLYRWPKQDAAFNNNFYQSSYSNVHRGIATDLPLAVQVQTMRACSFKNTNKDYSHYVALVKQLDCKSVLDYGCSWGYVTYQFQQAGVEAEGLEVSRLRAEFGKRHLGVSIHCSHEELTTARRQYDCIFTSHALEHLPSPRVALEFFERVMAPGAWLVCVVPNCGGEDALKHGLQWGPFSSAIHPLSYTEQFFAESLSNHQMVLAAAFSSPFSPQDVATKLHAQSAPFGANGHDLIILAQYLPGSNRLA